MWGATICNLDITVTSPISEVDNQANTEEDVEVVETQEGNELEEEDTLSDMSLECPVYLKEYIQMGQLNNMEEVRKLERFLVHVENENLEIDGFYGKEDFQAVVRFQEKYREEVLDPWKIIKEGQEYDYLPSVFSGFLRKLSRGTGYVYISTTKQINYLYCQHFYAGEIDF